MSDPCATVFDAFREATENAGVGRSATRTALVLTGSDAAITTVNGQAGPTRTLVEKGTFNAAQHSPIMLMRAAKQR